MLIHTISTAFTQITIYKIKKKIKNNENSIKKKERQKLKDKIFLSLLISKAGSRQHHEFTTTDLLKRKNLEQFILLNTWKSLKHRIASERETEKYRS